jgi:hypothetical protein
VEQTARPETIQLHLTLQYKFEPADEPRVKELLDDGYRISQLQRVSDGEALVTLTSRPL